MSGDKVRVKLDSLLIGFYPLFVEMQPPKQTAPTIMSQRVGRGQFNCPLIGRQRVPQAAQLEQRVPVVQMRIDKQGVMLDSPFKVSAGLLILPKIVAHGAQSKVSGCQ